MPFSAPNTFSTGILNALSLKQNMDAARSYINADIEPTDYDTDTFSTQDLQEGEFFGVTGDAIFLTGDQYNSFSASTIPTVQEKHYHTSTIKRQHPMTSVRYISVPQLAKQFYMEAPGSALIELSFFARELENDSCRGAVYPWTTAVGAGQSRSDGQQSLYVLALDGSDVRSNETRAYAFSEDGLNAVTFGMHSIMEGESGYHGGATGMRKFICMQFLAKDLAQGWHSIQVLVDPRNEGGYASSHTFCVETFYEVGYHECSASSIGTTIKSPSLIY
jgi:hypothetical protein